MNLPKYRCHKIVEAAPIWMIGTPSPRHILVKLGDAAVREIEIDPAKLFARYTPVLGDYFVIYEDGYQSISPKAAFEAGYTRIEE